MADTIYPISFVEDEPSKSVLIKLVERHNAAGLRHICFKDGFPRVTKGFGQIKVKCGAFLNMAASGMYSLTLTDLDNDECPSQKIRNWFFYEREGRIALPQQVIFRIAVREVEAWIMADREAFSDFLGIPVKNITDSPESLSDPKDYLLNILRKKAKTRKIKDMIPRGSAHIGPMYNEVICEFINNKWSVERACKNAPSLLGSVSALERL